MCFPHSVALLAVNNEDQREASFVHCCYTLCDSLSDILFQFDCLEWDFHEWFGQRVINSGKCSQTSRRGGIGYRKSQLQWPTEKTSAVRDYWSSEMWYQGIIGVSWSSSIDSTSGSRGAFLRWWQKLQSWLRVVQGTHALLLSKANNSWKKSKVFHHRKSTGENTSDE